MFVTWMFGDAAAAADTNQNGHSHDSKPKPKFQVPKCDYWSLRFCTLKIFYRTTYRTHAHTHTPTYAHIWYIKNSKQCLYFDRIVLLFMLLFYNFRVTFWGYDQVVFRFICDCVCVWLWMIFENPEHKNGYKYQFQFIDGDSHNKECPTNWVTHTRTHSCCIDPSRPFYVFGSSKCEWEKERYWQVKC